MYEPGDHYNGSQVSQVFVIDGRQRMYLMDGTVVVVGMVDLTKEKCSVCGRMMPRDVKYGEPCVVCMNPEPPSHPWAGDWEYMNYMYGSSRY